MDLEIYYGQRIMTVIILEVRTKQKQLSFVQCRKSDWSVILTTLVSSCSSLFCIITF